jgi:hypothetical protein
MNFLYLGEVRIIFGKVNGVSAMRIMFAIILSSTCIAQGAAADIGVQAASERGVVYRLAPQEFDALLDKRAEEKLAEETTQRNERRKLTKPARIGAGVLGLLGRSAAETARNKFCHELGSSCAGSSTANFRNLPDRRDPTRP